MKMITAIWQILQIMLSQIGNMLWDFFDDMPVMSHEAQRIFAHKEDRKLYTDAVEQLKFQDEVTITLHTGESITLIK